MFQIRRLTLSELTLPSKKEIVDEDGNIYLIEWNSTEITEPEVYKYTDIPIGDILELDERYSVSSLGIIYFNMPLLQDDASITTEFLEEPDLMLIVDLERHILKMIPFTCEGTECSFSIDQDSIVIPVKYVEHGSSNMSRLMSLSSEEDDSEVKMFNIISNANGKIEIELTELIDRYENLKDVFSTSEYYAIITDGERTKTVDIDEDMRFTYTSNNSGVLSIEILEDDLVWDDELWVQDVYVQKELSLTEQLQNELLEKYAPIVVYESDEEYAPMAIEEMFEQITDVTGEKNLNFKTVFGKHDVQVSNLTAFMPYNGHRKYLLDFNDDLANSFGSSFKSIKGDFAEATLYTWVQEDNTYYYLTYYFIYGYDKKDLIEDVDTWGIACHNLDRESMTVVLNKELEPLSVLTGGHLDTTKIKYYDDSGNVSFQWTGERVKTDYEQSISVHSQGHPIVYVEKGQHCIMPISGTFNGGVKNSAGLVEDIYNSDGTFNIGKIKAIFPEAYLTETDINKYSTKELEVDKLYGDNVLNFSGEWVDVLGTTNAKFPPFLVRDYSKTWWYSEATSFDKEKVELSRITKRSKEQFENAYLFSLSSIENFTYSVEDNAISLSWDELVGAEGYIITRERTDSSGESRKVIEINGDTEYMDDTVLREAVYKYTIYAYYKSNKAIYGKEGIVQINSNATELNDVSVNNRKATIVINVRDADTNMELSDVDVYVDNKYVGTTEGNKFTIEIAANTMHTVTTKKAGYIDVAYKEIVVNSGEVLALETLMQVPYSEGASTGSVSLTLKNAMNGRVVPNIEFVIRKGMNTTTGDVYTTAISNSQGEINLSEFEQGNYTGIIEDENYVKTIFNFVVIGGKSKIYEVHISPCLDDSEIRIVLSWNANPRDLDSHVKGDSVHVYYSNRVENGIQLDKDDTNGYGPETITIDTKEVSDNMFTYYVHRYAGTGTIAESGAVVRVYKGNTLIKTYYADQTDNTDIWYVCKIDALNKEIMDY